MILKAREKNRLRLHLFQDSSSNDILRDLQAKIEFYRAKMGARRIGQMSSFWKIL